MKDLLNEYYSLVGKELTTEERLRRAELFLILQERYSLGNEPLDKRVKFQVDEGRYEEYGYALYSDDGVLLYIGIAKDPRSRFRQHLKDKDIASMVVIAGGTRSDIEKWEKKNIEMFMPPLNKNLVVDGKWINWTVVIDALTERVIEEEMRNDFMEEYDSPFEAAVAEEPVEPLSDTEITMVVVDPESLAWAENQISSDTEAIEAWVNVDEEVETSEW